MRRFYILLLPGLLCFVTLQVQGFLKAQRRCRPFKEFQCFWDGACIPIEMKCDGKHDCVNGEDETEWFAGCKNCPENQFHCHKETFSLSCIDKDYMCDGIPDCFEGEDETFEFAKCKKQCKRDLLAALRAGRLNCRKECKTDDECNKKKCKPGEECVEKKCICDYECGKSCITTSKTCPKLGDFPHLQSIRYVYRDRKTNKVTDAKEPFKYDVHAYHTCEPGYEALPTNVRMCHGRGENPWTREIICARLCPARDDSQVKKYKLNCGAPCKVDADCEAGKVCTCDGPCGRTCVNLDVECEDAPEVENAYIEYTGEKFDRVAHYICKEGFYIDGGDSSRKCTGSSKYDGSPLVCKPVTCSDPVRSITRTGGKIVGNYSAPYYFGATLEFECGDGQRLLGSPKRTCMGDGKWSGLITVCDNKGDLERCPHPGIPVGGELKDSPNDEDFVVGKWVEFRCDDGLVLIGEKLQQCLYIKEWSGDGAPLCVDPRYSDSATDVIDKLKSGSDNMRPVAQHMKAGRTIRLSSGGKIEVYFIIDLSLSVKPLPLKNTIDFAQALIKRLSLDDNGRVHYGIIVFATTPQLMLDIHDIPRKKPEEVIEMLSNIEKDIDKIRKKIKMGTNIQAALVLLNQRQLAFSYESDPDLTTKRHIIVLTDGAKNAGGDPSDARRDIEGAYADNPPEFYSITSSARGKDPAAREELQSIASKHANFVYVDDFYKMHTYVDQITDAREDYSPCGQAGEVGSIRKMVSRGRTIGGEDAAERAWPWQVLVTVFDENLMAAFENVKGGGSLINSKWILSAAHVFDGYCCAPAWEQMFMLSMGIVKRPYRPEMLQGSVRIYQPEKIITHEEFNKYEGKPAIGTFQNDIALIKIGGEYGVSEDARFITMPEDFQGFVDYSPYIRPVCLPCSPDSCVSKILMKEDSKGNVLLTGDETPEERCQIEYDFLMGKNDEGLTAVVATGFGHNESRTDDDEGWIVATDNLQQAVLHILDREKCKDGATIISRQKSIEGFKHVFTDQMLCAVGNIDAQKGKKIVDTCKGDSGGPLAREVRDDTTKESCFVQVGIVSWGYGCGQVTRIQLQRYFYPAFYTDVTSMVSWINETMAEYEDANE